jgi:hypothetical protein
MSAYHVRIPAILNWGDTEVWVAAVQTGVLLHPPPEVALREWILVRYRNHGC